MSRLLLVTVPVFLGCFLFSYTVFSEDSSNSTTNNSSDTLTSVSKDECLKDVIPILPELICKGFEKDPELKNRLDKIKMTHDQCVAAIPESINKCKQQLYASIPDQITNDSAAVWGKTLGECIGQDFAVHYLIPKNK